MKHQYFIFSVYQNMHTEYARNMTMLALICLSDVDLLF